MQATRRPYHCELCLDSRHPANGKRERAIERRDIHTLNLSLPNLSAVIHSQTVFVSNSLYPATIVVEAWAMGWLIYCSENTSSLFI